MIGIVSWTTIKTEIDSHGTFTQLIKWIPPEDSGFIVQYVCVEDPFQLLSGYDKPYYEAWRVESGQVVYDAPGPEEYDDSFSNCFDGDWPGPQIAIDTAERQMKRAASKQSYVAYHCHVFWVPDGSAGAEEIKCWKTGEEEGICMAGKLKVSYKVPANIGEGNSREFKADFQI